MYEQVTINVNIDDDVIIEKVVDKIENDICYKDYSREEIEKHITEQVQNSGIIYEGVCEVEIELPEGE